MLSHISNHEVRRISNEKPLTQTVLFRQLNFLAKVARAPDDSEIRCITFRPGTVELVKPEGARGRGRPRLRWETVVHAHALAAAGSASNLSNIIYNSKAWRAAARAYSYPR